MEFSFPSLGEFRRGSLLQILPNLHKNIKVYFSECYNYVYCECKLKTELQFVSSHYRYRVIKYIPQVEEKQTSAVSFMCCDSIIWMRCKVQFCTFFIMYAV